MKKYYNFRKKFKNVIKKYYFLKRLQIYFSLSKKTNATSKLITLANKNSTPKLAIMDATRGLPASSCQTRVMPVSVTKWKKKYATANTPSAIRKVIKDNFSHFFSSFFYLFLNIFFRFLGQAYERFDTRRLVQKNFIYFISV